MIPEITDMNMFFLLPGKVSAVVGKYVDENKVNLLDGLRKFYHSTTYKNLEREQTKLWHLGPVALYQMFADELGGSVLSDCKSDRTEYKDLQSDKQHKVTGTVCL